MIQIGFGPDFLLETEFFHEVQLGYYYKPEGFQSKLWFFVSKILTSQNVVLEIYVGMIPPNKCLSETIWKVNLYSAIDVWFR